MEALPNCWCVLVMLGDDYAPGAAVVAKSLRMVGTKWPIVCMVTPDVSTECRAWLGRSFDYVIDVPFISHECVPMKSRKQNMIYGPWIHHSFTKCNIFNPALFPYNKVILIDADMIFKQNCDDLFDLQAPAMTFSSPWARPYMRARTGDVRGRVQPNNNPYGEMSHGSIVSNTNIRKGFNGGILGLACMILVRPNTELNNTMHQILAASPKYGYTNCMSGFDEQLFAESFLAVGAPIRHIHQSYNWIVGKNNWLLNGETPRTQQYYNTKPWHMPADSYPDVAEWWALASTVPEIEQWTPSDKK